MRRYVNSTLTVFIASLALSLTACDVSVEGANAPINEKPSGSVGPFDIEFDAQGNYAGGFDAPISQPAGSVEFLLAAPAKTIDFQLVSTSATGTGCSAATNVSLYWNEDTSQPNAFRVRAGEWRTLQPGKAGKILVIFEGLDGCTRLKFNVNMKRTPEPGPVVFPSNFFGLWERIDNFAGQRVTFQTTFTAKADGSVAVSYFNDCGNGVESMIGTVAKTTTTTTPNRISMRIDQVTREFFGGCSNVLLLKKASEGKYLNCLAERAANAEYASFKLACVIDATTEKFPFSWESAQAYWRY